MKTLIDMPLDNIFSFIQYGFENQYPEMKVKKVGLINNNDLEFHFYSKLSNSIDIKNQIASVIGFLYGFFKDEKILSEEIKNYAIKVYNSSNIELMYALSSKDSAKAFLEGDAIRWSKQTIFQENTRDFRLSIAKQIISEIETGLRFIIVEVLTQKLGEDWFRNCLAPKLFKQARDNYKSQFGLEESDGAILIEYTYFVHLKAIIFGNWNLFNHLFSDKQKFGNSFDQLNLIRRNEAHNRDITESELETLRDLQILFLEKIAAEYEEIAPKIFIQNWRERISEIMTMPLVQTFTENEIDYEENHVTKFVKVTTNTNELISHLQNKVLRLNSINIPLSKRKIHFELIELLNRYKTLFEELLSISSSGNLKETEKKNKEIKEYSKKLHEFSKKYNFDNS